MNKKSTEDFTAVKLFCIRLSWWIHVSIQLSKPIEYITQRVNYNGNYTLWVMMMYQYNCNKCTTLVQDFDSGVGCRWGQRVYGKSLYLLLNFVVNLKLPS